MDISNLKIIFVLGPPGAGKGTICEYLDDSNGLNGYKHLSTGDFLRSVCAAPRFGEGADLGGISADEVREHVKQSKSLPTETIVALLKDELSARQVAGDEAWIIDGFPRSVEAAKSFETQLTPPVGVVMFECPKDVARDRFIARKRSSTDDTELFERRYAEYQQYSQLIADYYTDRLRSVQTTEPIEQSSDQLKKILEDFSRVTTAN